MGMFDELRCEYPLPDGWEPRDILFQTKDTPQQYLALYVLAADGALFEAETHERVPYHGALHFYTDNISGIRHDCYFTSDDAPAWEATYCALFDHGTLLKLEGQKRATTTARRHVTRAVFYGRHEEAV